LFAVAVSDCYLNGPALREEEKLLAVGLSVVAVIGDLQWLFLLAELGWFIVFARAGWEPKESAVLNVQPVSGAAAVKEEVKVAKNSVPEPLKKVVDASYEMFLKNRQGDISCDGEKWELQSDVSGDKIWRAKYPGQSVYRWRAESTLYGPLSGILGELFDYTKRAGPTGWDPNLAKGRVHKQYDDGYKILIYSSNPVLGGLISPREFVEVRVVKGLQPDGSYSFSGVGIDEKMFGSILGSDFPQTDKNCTRASALPGGGFYMFPVTPGLDPETPQEWKFQLSVSTLAGGWLPASTVNSAAATVLGESIQAQKAHIAKIFGNRA